ncbi:hypothetical protein D3C76_1428640 [compost metagenome]
MPVAAEALAKNPANVIPTCIVAKKLLGSSSSFINASAFLFPSAANIFILFLFKETIAISDAAKKAFIHTNIKIMIMLPNEFSSIKNTPS